MCACGEQYCHEWSQLLLIKNVEEIQQLWNHCETSPKENEEMDSLDECDRTLCQIREKRNEIFVSMENALNLLNEIQELINEQLKKWKHQQIQMNSTSPSELDGIQSWLNELFSCVMDIRTLFKRIYSSHVHANVIDGSEEKFNEMIMNSLKNLIKSSVIVEKQPPKVIRKDIGFDASVRVLITQFSNVSNTIRVSVSILSESQSIIQQQQQQSLSESSGCVINNTGDMKFQPDNGHLTCNLKRLTVKGVTRKDENELPTNDFVFLFRLKFQMNDILIDIWTMSTPVVVYTFSSQASRACATVLWRNAFSANDGNPFSVVDKVPWSQLASILNEQFTTQAGRSLTKEHLDHLCDKLISKPSNTEDNLISFYQFCVDPLPNRKFTFYEWFYSIMEITRKHLRDAWQSGLIAGFIKRKKAEEMLEKCLPGTFLLRFTDTILGGVSVAVVEKSNGKSIVSMLQPYADYEFDSRRPSIGDQIKDLKQCLYLYPDIPKVIAFGLEDTHSASTLIP
ncbi:signal transducer and transcription activator-like, partial [Contarinia nasturtii]|uniref:signal transducer and transcription activator-like n=1 Tax=Contarinia nasturtii TaxID=265458 RepID=UPI0012D46AA5